MKIARSDIMTALEILLGDNKNQIVTVFAHAKDIKKVHRVRVARRKFKHKKGFGNGPVEVLITIGKPNYREVKYLKTCVKRGLSSRYWVSKRLN